MKYTQLPNTQIEVSKICLGTMTFGRQNTETEGHAQIDYALDQGINFIDTAEMYPVPAHEPTYGHTEIIIGNWLKKTGKRSEIVLASKIAGANRGLAFIREDLGFNAQTIRESLDKSLSRLQTDYIDLYQLHWPERKVNFFGQRAFKAEDDAWEDNIQSVLEALSGLIREGKIRTIGLSNETPWGVMRFLEESKKHDLPKITTIQNPYSLVNRTFEMTLHEIAYREKVGLLAYSPLAFGLLSGKYNVETQDPNARLNLFPNFARYNSQSTREASKMYQQIASDHGLSVTQMALAFVQQQSFVTSTIIGATSMAQLEENIGSQNMELSDSIVREIEKVQNRFPDPAP
ncbi:NADP(H)-dependent aldo-keto reductase [Flavobacterium sp.]|uniref:NADP(H)-dependent aldo-keto reductase n=1 Tax=Flavobacterium sp. TaxID=239 RepID=UPI0039E57200